MKNLITLSIILLTAFMTQANEYQENTHYAKVSGLAANQAEVREYFSFFCPHCYRYEPLMAAVKNNLPSKVKFVKNHVDFLPGTSKKMQRMLTKAMITAQVIDVEEAQIAAIFKYIHVHRAVFTSLRDVKNIFVLNGVDGELVEQTMASEEVNDKANSMFDHQQALSKSGGIKAVPAIIVNGKYRVIAKELDKDNFEQDYTKLVNFLLTLD